MTRRPPISFVVPIYNYGHFLPQAIASIVDGNLESEDEILIVNDASTDNTADVMRELAQKSSQIKPLTHRYNKGCFNAGLNTAIEAANHGLLFGLAADNLLAPNSVDGLVAFMTERAADVAAFQEVRFFTKDITKPTHSWIFHEECTLADALSGHEWPGSSGHYLFTRGCWQRAGRADEFFGGLDSWAFGIQLLGSGSKMVSMPRTYYLHRWGHDSLWRRETVHGKLSAKALRALLPILDQFEPATIEYLFNEGRTNWFENLKDHPLKVREKPIGRPGRIVQYRADKGPLLERVRRYLARKLAPGVEM